jgi:hypothetical protein
VSRTEFATYETLATRISAKELSTLLKVSSSLASTMELSEVLQIAIESVADLLGLGYRRHLYPRRRDTDPGCHYTAPAA